MTKQAHISVLLHEAVDALITDINGFYIDGTFGRGGHSQVILSRLSPQGRLMAVDKDLQAIATAKALFGDEERFSIYHGSFAQIKQWVQSEGVEDNVSGILLDLGVSSPQLDESERGFSFMQDGPLDMRMNTSKGETAEQWINTAEESKIAQVLKDYGEERFAKRMARAIVTERDKKPISTTKQLAEIVAQANPAWEKGKHPATRAFQAIRIFINDELKDLDEVLEQALDVLAIGGRLVVISFHSLEDRKVKRFIRRQVKGDPLPASLPIPDAKLNKRLRTIGKAIKAGQEELQNNPRARSAVMRVAEKIA